MEQTFKPVFSIFDGWKRQCFDWTDGPAGALDITEFFRIKFGREWKKEQKVLDFTNYLSGREKIAKDIRFTSKRSLVKVFQEFPENVLVCANDIRRMSIEELITVDLEYQFGLEFVLSSIEKEGNKDERT